VPGFTGPYPRTPYHSKDFTNGYHPQDAFELFNQHWSNAWGFKGMISYIDGCKVKGGSLCITQLHSHG